MLVSMKNTARLLPSRAFLLRSVTLTTRTSVLTCSFDQSCVAGGWAGSGPVVGGRSAYSLLRSIPKGINPARAHVTNAAADTQLAEAALRLHCVIAVPGKVDVVVLCPGDHLLCGFVNRTVTCICHLPIPLRIDAARNAAAVPYCRHGEPHTGADSSSNVQLWATSYSLEKIGGLSIAPTYTPLDMPLLSGNGYLPGFSTQYMSQPQPCQASPGQQKAGRSCEV